MASNNNNNNCQNGFPNSKAKWEEATSITVKNIPWSEIQKHSKEDDSWLVVQGKAYNVTRWAERHPGGRRILSYHAGRDATVCNHYDNTPIQNTAIFKTVKNDNFQ